MQVPDLKKRRFMLMSVIVSTVLPSISISQSAEQIGSNPLKPLISALRSTNKLVCSDTANQLDSSGNSQSFYDIHLRNADLNTEDATLVAAGLEEVKLLAQPRLRSFSVSYNQAIGVSGVEIILVSLPETVQELGMVGCKLTDESANPINNFLKRSKALRMICVEDNLFSRSVKVEIKKAASHLPNCITIV
ncbi:MAG: hypothetical protein ACKVI1_00890 [Flavobacteriales bacterium]|jgi:hypothetical protein